LLLAGALGWFKTMASQCKFNDRVLVHDGDYAPEAASEVRIGFRLFSPPREPARVPGGAPGAGRLAGRPPRGVLVYWHGNGEVAADYDAYAELFNLLGRLASARCRLSRLRLVLGRPPAADGDAAERR